jgi:hypothetical protein
MNWLSRLKPFTLAGLEEQIACPVLSVIGTGEGAAAVAQARAFHETLGSPKTFIPLTRELAADNHCGVNNVPYTASLIFDWIDNVFLKHVGSGRFYAATAPSGGLHR